MLLVLVQVINKFASLIKKVYFNFNPLQEIYNKLTEMAVEKVKIKDMSEVKRYELMNKIFALENDLLKAQIVAEEWKGKYDDVSNDRMQIEELKNDLQAEYITLKTNHHSSVSKQTTLERKCEQLSLELVQLHMDHEQMTMNRTPFASSPSLPEIKRAVSDISHTPSSLKPSNSGTIEQMRLALEAQRTAGNGERNRLLQEIMALKAQLGEESDAVVRKAQQKELLQRTLTLQVIRFLAKCCSSAKLL